MLLTNIATNKVTNIVTNTGDQTQSLSGGRQVEVMTNSNSHMRTASYVKLQTRSPGLTPFNRHIKSVNLDLINECRFCFNFSLPSELLEKRIAKFQKTIRRHWPHNTIFWQQFSQFAQYM